MSCSSNPKRFLGMRWNGGHSFKIERVCQFSTHSLQLYSVTRRCACGLAHGGLEVHKMEELKRRLPNLDHKKLEAFDFGYLNLYRPISEFILSDVEFFYCTHGMGNWADCPQCCEEFKRRTKPAGGA